MLNEKGAIFLSIAPCDRGRIQTCNLLSRNQGLYSVKLRDHLRFASAKVQRFGELAKKIGNFFLFIAVSVSLH